MQISIFGHASEYNKSYTSCLVKFDVLSLLYSPTGEHNKTEICKMAASRFVEVTAKGIRKLK